MTRFEQELSGALGAYWKASAEKELAEIREELATGRITIDAYGVARNCLGRVIMGDLAERVSYVTKAIDRSATAAAREVEVERSAAAYRESRQKNGYSHEELHEMRAAFGQGAKIIDILTGATITV